MGATGVMTAIGRGSALAAAFVVIATVVAGCDDSASESDPVAGADTNGQRVTTDGVTFVVPDALADDIQTRPVRSSPQEGVVEVHLLDAAAQQRGSVVVAAVRDADTPQTSTGTSDQELGSLGDGSDEATDIDFVNGAGLRMVAGDEYVYSGLTSDGMQLVEVRAAADLGVDSLDELAGTIFVDGQAEVLAPAGCDAAISVIGEVVVDDSVVVRPGETVTATWPTRNSGTCDWSAQDGWVFAGGDGVEVIEVTSVAGVPPGDELDVSVAFRAPDEPGRYTTQWQFLPAGELEPIDTPIPVAFEVSDT